MHLNELLKIKAYNNYCCCCKVYRVAIFKLTGVILPRIVHISVGYTVAKRHKIDNVRHRGGLRLSTVLSRIGRKGRASSSGGAARQARRLVSLQKSYAQK